MSQSEERSAPQPQARSTSLLTAEQVGKRLGVPTSWVYEQSRMGRIPTVTLGRYRRYRPEAIDAWIEDVESGQPMSAGVWRTHRPRRRSNGTQLARS